MDFCNPCSSDKSGKTAGFLVMAITAFGLVACGGGGSGDSGGQSPDPVVVDLPIAYVKRPVPRDILDEDDDGNITEIVNNDVLEPSAFNPGAALYIRDRAAPGAAEINITDVLWPDDALYDVKDLDVSADGTKLVFAMRTPQDPDLDDDEQPKWDIWHYDMVSGELMPLLGAADAQGGHDVAPHFLPGDSRVVFSSDRQTRSRQIRLFDGKDGFSTVHEAAGGDPDYAFNLHTVNVDTGEVEQITFNQSHDLQPSVMDDGRILFLRWNNYGNTSDNLSLFTANPDGADVQFYYGFHSQNTGTEDSPGVFSRPRELPDGRVLVILRPRLDERFGGDLVTVDGANYTEIDQPVYANAGAAGPGQVSASLLEVATYDVEELDNPANLDDPGRRISRHGRFNSAFPLDDGTGRLMVGWNQCRLIDPEDEDQLNPTRFLPCTDENLELDPDTGALPHEAPPLYGLWVYDAANGTQLPVFAAEEETMVTDVVAMAEQPVPDVIPPASLAGDTGLREAGLGLVHIRSVYDFDGEDQSPAGIAATANPGTAAYNDRSARFLRLIKAVGIPDDDTLDFDNGAFGLANPRIMKEIFGYVPVEPDGSVKFRIPADMAFSFSVIDELGRRVSEFPRHQVWLQLRPGEALECNGCHTAGSELPHGRRTAEAPSANPGAATSAAFPGTQPTLQAEIGESMAETWSRINGPRVPSVDLHYEDGWSLSPPAAIDISYSDLITDAPVRPASCVDDWDALCRITINYPDHIQPLWEIARMDAGNDITCTNCHNKQDDANAPQIPSGQLELTADLGDNNLNLNTDGNGLQSISYRDLLLEDGELELDGGVLQQRVVIDSDADIDPDTGEIITPEENHIPICNPSMAANSARDSSNEAVSNEDCEGLSSPRDFFSWFEPDAFHEGYLNEAELKLISEWLDIGAQYYNNPYDAPLN